MTILVAHCLDMSRTLFGVANEHIWELQASKIWSHKRNIALQCKLLLYVAATSTYAFIVGVVVYPVLRTNANFTTSVRPIPSGKVTGKSNGCIGANCSTCWLKSSKESSVVGSKKPRRVWVLAQCFKIGTFPGSEHIWHILAWVFG